MGTIDWSLPNWSYMLGVVHGDGSVGHPRTISVSVGYKDTDYAECLMGTWVQLGESPKLYRARTALRVDVHSRVLRDEFALYKSRGRWSHPPNLDPGQYLAGVFDTDGCVSTPTSKHVSICLKRSGNLSTVSKMLSNLGVGDFRVIDRTSKFKGQPYDVETLLISGMDRIARFFSLVVLRSARKADRAAAMLAHIEEIRSRVPLWREVGLWLQEEPRTWEEIAIRFSLTRRQVDSVVQNLRRYTTVSVLPPPRVLSRFSVSGL